VPIPTFTGAAFANGDVTLTGTSEADSTVSVYEGLTLVGRAVADSHGNWTITGAGDANATHIYGAVATDLDGNTGESDGDYSPNSTPLSPLVPGTPDPSPPIPRDPPVPHDDVTFVHAGDSAATIQSKLDALDSGGVLKFQGNTTFDFQGTSIRGKSGVTLWADGVVNVVNAPGAGTKVHSTSPA